MRVWVVEDDADLSEILRSALADEGWAVTVTSGGLPAAAQAQARNHDVCLLDLENESLADGGAQQVIRELSSLPVIAVSAATSGWQAGAFAAGATACLPKPFDLAELVSLIESIAAPARTPPPWGGDVQLLSADDIARLSQLSPDQLDALPFGAVRLDPQGRVTAFNAYEANASHLPAERVLGRLFADVAPCSTVRHFAGAAREAFERGEADRMLRLVFPHHSAWVLMNVRMFFDRQRGELWLFTSKRHGEPLTAGDREVGESLARTPRPTELLP